MVDAATARLKWSGRQADLRCGSDGTIVASRKRTFRRTPRPKPAQSTPGAESCRSPRLRSQSTALGKAAIQTLSELNSLAALDAKVSDAQEAEYAKLRWFPAPDLLRSTTRQGRRLTIPEPAATGKRNRTISPGQSGRDRSSIANLRVSVQNRHDPTRSFGAAVPRQVRFTKTHAPGAGRQRQLLQASA